MFWMNFVAMRLNFAFGQLFVCIGKTYENGTYPSLFVLCQCSYTTQLLMSLDKKSCIYLRQKIVNHSEFLLSNVSEEILISQVIIKISVATTTATSTEKYHKGCNLVVLLYCVQLSMQCIITVSTCSLGTVVSWGLSGGKDEQWILPIFKYNFWYEIVQFVVPIKLTCLEETYSLPKLI